MRSAAQMENRPLMVAKIAQPTKSDEGRNLWGDACDGSVKSPAFAIRSWRRRAIRAVATLIGCISLLFVGSQLSGLIAQKNARGVLSGEFEQQQALLFAWTADLTHDQRDSLSVMIAACWQNVQIVMLVPNMHYRMQALQQVETLGVPPEAIQFVTSEVSFLWVRDYGPLVLKSFDGRFDVLDVWFDPSRPNCERVPQTIASQYDMRHKSIDMVLQGGNLLSNGAGLYLTTERLLVSNRDVFGHGRPKVTRMLEKHLGATNVVYLQPLDGERTGHIDMFATFTAVDTIVVGAYDAREDPVNARILDENAKRLSGLVTPCGPLKVVRIPMPPRNQRDWWTYTNVVYANGILIVPSYPDVDPELEKEALNTYRNLLRGWQIKTVNSAPLMVNGGGPRCATLNLYRTARDQGSVDRSRLEPTTSANHEMFHPY